MKVRVHPLEVAVALGLLAPAVLTSRAPESLEDGVATQLVELLDELRDEPEADDQDDEDDEDRDLV